MADPERRKKPRIRKTAPTVREAAEQATAQAQQVPRQRRKMLTRVLFWPFRKIFRSDNRVSRTISRLLRPVLRVLKWMTPSYFVNSWRELKQVTWPGRRETWRLTGAVFMFAIIFGAMITVVDKIIDKFFKELIIK